jgi:hypothetical protein
MMTVPRNPGENTMEPSSSSTALARLLAPLSPDEFFARYWLRKHAAIHGPLSRLPEWLSAPLLQHFHRLAADYRGGVSLQQSSRSNKQVPVSGVHPADLFEMGLTVYFHDIVKQIPGLEAYAKALEDELGLDPGGVKVAAFASPTGEGLGFHYDTGEIFSVQLRGTKTFDLAPVTEVEFPCGLPNSPGTTPSDETFPQMNNGFPSEAPQTYETVTMQPGTVLYMPRGTWHRTQAGEDSLSVSIAFAAPTALDTVLAQLRMLLLQDPRWRHPIYGLRGGLLHDGAGEQIGELLKRLPQQVQALGAGDVLMAKVPESQRWRKIHVNSRFIRNPACTVRMEPGPEQNGDVRLALRTHERGFNQPYGRQSQLDIHADIVPAIQWMDASRQPFTLAELLKKFPALEKQNLVESVRVLAEAGMLKMLWYPALPDPDPTRGQFSAQSASRFGEITYRF